MSARPIVKEAATLATVPRPNVLTARQDTGGPERLAKSVLTTLARALILWTKYSQQPEQIHVEYRATPTVMYARTSRPIVSTVKQDTSGVRTSDPRFVNYVPGKPAKVRTL